MSRALILLAAGGSKRLGSPKQLVSFRGKTLLRHAAETALATKNRPVIVVLGEIDQSDLCGLDVTIVRNPNWEEGIASSIRAGLEHAETAEGVALMLCDQPLITSEFLDSLSATNQLSAAQYGGSVGVPAYFPKEFFPELKSLRGNEGAKKILIRHNARALPCPGADLDIDTPEQARALQ